MLEDIINSASNLVNTPGLLMMGVGVVSAVVLKTLVFEANKSSPALINYHTDSDEFPMPIPLSIYEDGREKVSRANWVRPAEMTFSEPVGTPMTPPRTENITKEVDCLKNENALDEPKPVSDVLNDGRHPTTPTSVVQMMSAYHHGCSEPKKKPSNPPKPSKPEQPLGKCIQENSSDLAAGDTYLIVEPPEDSESEKETSTYSKTESYTLNSITLSSFTGPFVVPVNVDESSSQSVTWTDAFVTREPFDDEPSNRKTTEKTSQKTKLKNQKC